LAKDTDTRVAVLVAAVDNFRLERESGQIVIRFNEGTIVSIDKTNKIL
jgi:hypothetical protein